MPGGTAFEVGVLICGKDSSVELSPLTETHLYSTVHPGSGWPFFRVLATTVIILAIPHARQSSTFTTKSLVMLISTFSAAVFLAGSVFKTVATLRHQSASFASSSTYSLGGGTAANSPLLLFHPISSPRVSNPCASSSLDESAGARLAMLFPHFCKPLNALAVGPSR